MAGDISVPGASPPDAAANAALAAYNGEQAAVAASVRTRLPIFIGGALALTAGALAFVSMVDAEADWTDGWHIAIYFFGVMGTLLAWDHAEKPAKRLQQQLRDRVLPFAFSFLEKPAYAHATTPLSAAMLPAKAIGSFNRTTYGDVISGRHENVDLEIFEGTYKLKSGKTDALAFKGLVLAFKLDKPFPGLLIAVRRTGEVTRWFRDLFGGQLETYDFADPSVGEAFEVRSSNHEATRQLIDGPLAKALAFLRDTWPDGQPRLALNEDSGFVLLPTHKDFFELPKIGTPVHYAAHIEPMALELRSLAALAVLGARIG